MTNGKLLIFILVTLVSGLIIIPKTAMSEQGNQLQGKDLELIAESLKSKFILGEPIDIILRIKNLKSEPITVIRPEVHKILHGWSLVGYIYRPWDLSWGRKRIVRPAILFSMERFLEQKDFIQLKPGEDIAIDIHFDSPIHREYSSGPWNVEPSAIGRMNDIVRDDILKECFSHVGEYAIKFTLESTINKYYEFLDDKGHVREIKVDAWTGKVSSSELKIKVVSINK